MTRHEMELLLQLKNLTPELGNGENEIIQAGYASDLLSDVLANGPQGGVLITIQVHLNVIAVAVHAELTAVIFPMDRIPDETVRQKAVEEGIALYSSSMTCFDLVGLLYKHGIQGALMR